MRVTLNDISIIKGEYGGGFSAVDYAPDKPRYIRITDILDNGYLAEDAKAPSGEPSDWKKYRLSEGDLLFARSGATVGKTFLYQGDYPAVFAGYLIRFRFDLDKVLPKYVFYYTKTPQYWAWIAGKQNVVAQPNINAKQYGFELELPLPSLPEQRRIAEILDAADALRQKDRALIEKYEQLAQSLFLEMFGDYLGTSKDHVKLGDISLVKGEYGGGFSAVEYNPDFPRYIRITDIGDNGGLVDKAKSPSGRPNDWRKYKLEHEDLLFTRTGATVGKTLLYDAINGYSIFAGYLIRFRLDTTKVVPKYVFFYTKTDEYKSWVSNVQRVVAQPNINAKQYSQELLIPLPPLTLQQSFAERVGLIERQKQQAQAALAKSEELFGALLQQLFA